VPLVVSNTKYIFLFIPHCKCTCTTRLSHVCIHIYATHIDGVFMYCCMCVRGSQFPVMLPHQFKTQLTPVTLTQLQHAITYYCLPPAYQVDCCPPARSRPVDMESGVVLLFYTRREAICIFMHAAFSYKAWWIESFQPAEWWHSFFFIFFFRLTAYLLEQNTLFLKPCKSCNMRLKMNARYIICCIFNFLTVKNYEIVTFKLWYHCNV
jgi:hypothetical protein